MANTGGKLIMNFAWKFNRGIKKSDLDKSKKLNGKQRKDKLPNCKSKDFLLQLYYVSTYRDYNFVGERGKI